MALFVVIDEAGEVSHDDEGRPELFSAQADADKRASQLALGAPGEQIFVCQAIREVVAKVSAPIARDFP